MQISQYTNIAFISYKREDEEWAKWLQKKLEHYKLPTEIRKQNPDMEFANNPRHVFKDTTDLSGGVLAKAIKEGLDSSKFLIVICSPRAAKSEWVCKEVQAFIDSGREEYIVPFIIDGEPYSKDIDKECFPEALKSLAGERELLGININENGRDSAAVKVVSRLFNVRFDTLWNRFQREQKKRRKYTIVSLVTAIFVVACVAGFIWMQNKELQEKNTQIEQQNKDLDAKSDSITNVNTALIVAKDSIQRAYEKLDLSERNLAKSNEDLKESNLRLAEERDNVLKANWKMMENQGRAVAEKAKEIIAEGDVMRGAALALEVYPSKEGKVSRPYLPEVEQALRTAYDSLSYSYAPYCLLKGHSGEILSACFVDNGESIFTSSNDGTIRKWNSKTGEEQMCIQKEISVPYVIPWKNNQVIVSDYHNNYEIINYSTGEITDLPFSGMNPVGNVQKHLLVTGGEDGGIWDMNTYKKIMKLPDTYFYAFSDDSKIFAYEKGDSLYICETDQWKLISKLKLTESTDKYDGICSLLFTDEDNLYVTTAHRLFLLSAYTGSIQGFIEIPSRSTIRSTPQKDYIIASTKNEGTVRFFKCGTLMEDASLSLNFNEDNIIDAQIDPSQNCLMVNVYADGQLYLYPNPLNQHIRSRQILPLKQSDNTFISCGGDGYIMEIDDLNIKVYDSKESKEMVYKIPSYKESKSKNGKIYTMSDISQIVTSFDSGISASVYVSDKKTIHIFNNIIENEVLQVHVDTSVVAVALNRKGNLMAIGCRDKKMFIYDINQKKIINELHCPGIIGFTHMCFENDNVLITASHDHTIRRWDLQKDQEIINKRLLLNFTVKGLAISSNCNYLAYSDNYTVHILDYNTYKEIDNINRTSVKGLAFSDSNDRLYLHYEDNDFKSYFGSYAFVQISDVESFLRNSLDNYKLTTLERKRYYLE